MSARKKQEFEYSKYVCGWANVRTFTQEKTGTVPKHSLAPPPPHTHTHTHTHIQQDTDSSSITAICVCACMRMTVHVCMCVTACVRCEIRGEGCVYEAGPDVEQKPDLDRE